uniref:Transposase Tc1-like domain-containing protein n=1 Tax=Oncorhynchus tshawytscha TaxID=74940 RepID=A0AAZ3RIP5_ONCTS
MTKLVLMRTATGMEDPELPLLQRISSLELPASEIAAQVNASQSSSNRHISTLTVQRRLCESGLHGRIAAKKPILQDTNKKKRLAWVTKQEQWTLDRWKSVLWSGVKIGDGIYLEFKAHLTSMATTAFCSNTPSHLVWVWWDFQHTSRMCKGYLTKKESDGVLHQMTWPQQSPDLKQIETIWDESDRREKEKQSTSAQHMWEPLQDF